MHAFNRIFAVLIIVASTTLAQTSWLFPRQSEVVDVTKEPYFATGDGKTDDTEAIQRAFDDHPNGNHIIFLPHGVYKVSRQISWARGADSSQAYRRTILQGESMGGTIMWLVDNAPGFDNPQIPRPVLYTGLGPAPRYRNSIRDLTLLIGKDNPGAIGIRFNAAVQGTLYAVKISSKDGQGVAGLDFSFADNIGPLLVKNVEIQGFDVGILTRSPYNGMTLENVHLSGQSKYCLENHDQVLSIRNFTCRTSGTGILNEGPTAMLTLIDAKLEYTGKKGGGTAIDSRSNLFARGIITSRFGQAVADNAADGSAKGKGVKGPEVDEYSSHPVQSVCHTLPQSLKLPVAETPLLPWGDPAKWVAISGDYGGTAGDGTDDSKAIQQAIDDGAETIFFTPGGRYTITKDIVIRKNLRRMIGTEAKIDGSGKFIVADGLAKAVVIERFASLAGGIKHMTNRTLILKNMTVGAYESRETGAGDVYLEDVSASPMIFHLQHVWARQLHMDYDKGAKIINDGGFVWILGLTTERGNTIVHTRNRGMTEILGAHIIATSSAKTRPMFLSDTSGLSIAGLRETAALGNPFATLVSETRKDMTMNLLGKDQPRNATGGSNLLLFAGYTQSSGTNKAPKVKLGADQILVLPRNAPLSGTVVDDGRADGLCRIPGQWLKITGPGRVSFSHPKEYATWSSFSYSGLYDIQFSAHDGKLQGSDTVRILAYDKRVTTKDHNGDNIPSGNGADTWVEQALPNANHGREPALLVRNTQGTGAKTYLRFDISSLPGPVSDAALQFKIKPREDGSEPSWNIWGLRDTTNFGVDRLNEKWHEDSLTWSNAPGNSEQAGGTYNVRKGIGGGMDTLFTTWLGKLEPGPHGYFFQSRLMVDWLKKDRNKSATFILTAEDKYPDGTWLASRDHGKVEAPALYLSYIDRNKSVGGDRLPGGFKLSPVEVDPFSLQCSFTLMVGHPQFVQIEIYSEIGKRMMILNEKVLEGEVLIPFQFNAKVLESGSYVVKVKGEAFESEQWFAILN